jgi:hypothetical protein
MKKLIDYHLADPKTPREIELPRRALSRYCQREADVHFARAEFAQALGSYRRSWRRPREERRDPGEALAVPPRPTRQRVTRS